MQLIICMAHLISKKVNKVGEGKRKKKHSLIFTLIVIYDNLKIYVIITVSLQHL